MTIPVPAVAGAATTGERQRRPHGARGVVRALDSRATSGWTEGIPAILFMAASPPDTSELRPRRCPVTTTASGVRAVAFESSSSSRLSAAKAGRWRLPPSRWIATAVSVSESAVRERLGGGLGKIAAGGAAGAGGLGRGGRQSWVYGVGISARSLPGSWRRILDIRPEMPKPAGRPAARRGGWPRTRGSTAALRKLRRRAKTTARAIPWFTATGVRGPRAVRPGPSELPLARRPRCQRRPSAPFSFSAPCRPDSSWPWPPSSPFRGPPASGMGLGLDGG